MTDVLTKRISAYLEKLPPAVSGQRGHDTTYRVASVLVWGFALSAEQALEFMLAYNCRCVPPWSEAQLRHKIRTAARAINHRRERGYLLEGEFLTDIGKVETLQEPPKPKYDPERLARFAARVNFDITPEYLEAHSKFTCWNRSPAGVLHKLFHPGEKAIVFNVFASQGCELWEHKGNGQDLSTLAYLERSQPKGVWFLANPVHGEYVYLDRLKSEKNPEGKSRRCEECVTSWRYLLFESDDAPKGVWLRALVQMPLRIAAICDSGGKSVHALLRVDAESKKHWDEVRARFLPGLVRHGACDGSLSAVRLTRLPNCMRGCQLQRLLYLNDTPARTPICEIPVREDPEIARQRWGLATTQEKLNVS